MSKDENRHGAKKPLNLVALALTRPHRFVYVALFFAYQMIAHLMFGIYCFFKKRPKRTFDPVKKDILYLVGDTDFYAGTTFSYGGHVAHIKGVIDAFVKKGYRVHLVTNQKEPNFDHPNVIKHLIEPACKIEESPVLEFMPWNRQLANQAIKIGRSNPVAFIYQRHASLIFAGGIVADKLGVPGFLEVNSPLGLFKRNLLSKILFIKFFEKIAFTLADKIFAVSDLGKELLAMNYKEAPKDKIVVNPNGVNPQDFSPSANKDGIREKYGIGKNQFLVGFSGVFSYWHGIEVLLEGFFRFAKKHSDCHLGMIGGGGALQEYEKLIAKAGMEKRVTFFGIVPFEKVPSLLGSCDLLVSPQVRLIGKSNHQSPIKLFEYMAMEKPIVASRIGQIAQVIRNKENGILVEPGNPEELAEAFSVIYNDRQLATRLGKNAREDVLKNYNWESNVERILGALLGCENISRKAK